MQILRKLLRRKATRQGVVGISFLPQGIAVALSKYKADSILTLSLCEFIPVADPSRLEEALYSLLHRYKLGKYDCHLVILGSDYRSTNIEAPAVAEDEMREAIRWKINEVMDFPIDTTNIDYYAMPAGKNASANKMLTVVASSNEVLEKKVGLCHQAGLQLQIIDIQETVLRNLAALLPENERGIAVLHLQKSTGMIIIQKSGTLYLSRKLDMGYERLGLAEGPEADDQVQQRQGNLALEIQRSLDYFESYYGIPAISGIAVIPMPDNTQQLLNTLNSRHGITARIMDLSAIMNCDMVLDDATQSLCAPVIGATLRYALESG